MAINAASLPPAPGLVLGELQRADGSCRLTCGRNNSGFSRTIALDACRRLPRALRIYAAHIVPNPGAVSVLCGVLGPAEARRKNEVVDRAYVEVIVQPQDGSSGTLTRCTRKAPV